MFPSLTIQVTCQEHILLLNFDEILTRVGNYLYFVFFIHTFCQKLCLLEFNKGYFIKNCTAILNFESS